MNGATGIWESGFPGFSLNRLYGTSMPTLTQAVTISSLTIKADAQLTLAATASSFPASPMQALCRC